MLRLRHEGTHKNTQQQTEGYTQDSTFPPPVFSPYYYNYYYYYYIFFRRIQQEHTPFLLILEIHLKLCFMFRLYYHMFVHKDHTRHTHTLPIYQYMPSMRHHILMLSFSFLFICYYYCF